MEWAGVAQLVEHLICNQRVGGSNPFASSTKRDRKGSLNGKKFSPAHWILEAPGLSSAVTPLQVPAPGFRRDSGRGVMLGMRVFAGAGEVGHRWPSG